MPLPQNSDIWIFGDYPTAIESAKGGVFSGESGDIIEGALASAGSSHSIYTAYISSLRPRTPDDWTKCWFTTKTQHLAKGYIPWGDKYVHPQLHARLIYWRELALQHRPRLIIMAGNLAFLALTDQFGVNNWRGSQLQLDGIRLVPTISPHTASKMWHWSYYIAQDIRRAINWLDEPIDPPVEDFQIRPTFPQVEAWANNLLDLLDRSPNPIPIGTDIETRFRHITCIGFAHSNHAGFCIPFASCERPSGYWPQEEEFQIVQLLRKIMTHKNFSPVGQNWLYDRQYIAREWGINVPAGFDTMLAWHTAYPGLEQSLGFISSMVLPYHIYWKEESGFHAPLTPEEENTYWNYNLKDAARTLELQAPLTQILKTLEQLPNYTRLMGYCEDNFHAMLRGVRVDTQEKSKKALEVMNKMAEYDAWFSVWTDALTGGHQLVKSKNASPWWRSPTQLSYIFYTIFRMSVIRNAKTGRPTCDEAALAELGQRDALFSLLTQRLIEYSSMGTFLSHCLTASLDWDNRIRCSYAVCAADTFRHRSSEDVFGYGTNLQNLPSGNEL